MIDENYSEESFAKQIKESGAVSFRNMPCPVHGSYPSLISLWGFSAQCCGKQSEWFEAEIDRLGLRPHVQKIREVRKQEAAEAERKAAANKELAQALKVALYGATVSAVIEPDGDEHNVLFQELELTTRDGKRFRLLTGDEKIIIEPKEG